MTKPSKRAFKAPAHLTQHRAAARRSAPPHETTPRQRGGRHATGPVSAHRRGGMFRAPIYERDWRPSCIVRRSSSSSVVSGQWCTHFDARDNRRLVAIKTAFARWRNPDELRGPLQHADEINKLHPISKIWPTKWLAANMAEHPSNWLYELFAPISLQKANWIIPRERSATHRPQTRHLAKVAPLGPFVEPGGELRLREKDHSNVTVTST